MVIGFILYDLLFIVIATLLYGGAVTVGARVFLAMSNRIPWALAIVPSLVCGLLVLIAEVFIATRLCPPLRPGRYRMMKTATFYSWLFRSMFRRLLFDFGLRWLLFSSNVLRFLALRAVGARVHFSVSMSPDVVLTDPSLLHIEAGAMVGARSYVTGHWIERGRLFLGAVEIGEGSLLAMDVVCAPGVTIGKKVMIKSRASIAPNVRIDDEADIGVAALVETGAHIGRRARIASCAHVARRQVIEVGAQFP